MWVGMWVDGWDDVLTGGCGSGYVCGWVGEGVHHLVGGGCGSGLVCRLMCGFMGGWVGGLMCG